MGNRNKRNIFPVAAGALSGITLGWAIRNYNLKRKQLEGYESLIDKVKSFERKVYEDGMQRANEIDGIKREVHRKVTD